MEGDAAEVSSEGAALISSLPSPSLLGFVHKTLHDTPFKLEGIENREDMLDSFDRDDKTSDV